MQWELRPQKDFNWGGRCIIFPIAHGTAKLIGRDHGVRESCKTGSTCKEWRSQRRTARKLGKVSTSRWSPQWHSVSGRWVHSPLSRRTSSSALRVESKNKLISLKHIDVTRTTHTNLDVWQESCIDDYWNVDVDRILWGSWQDSRSSLYWANDLQKGYMRSGDGLQRFKQPPDLIVCGQKHGPELVKLINERKISNGNR